MNLAMERVLAVGLVCLAAVWMAGCSKGQQQKTEFPAAPPPGATPAASAPTANASPAAAPAQPVLDNKKTYDDAEAAMKARDYDRAVAAALALQQQKQLTDAQAQAARNQMVRLQQQIAGAAAGGDPRAKAAADRLRAAAAHH